MKFAGYDGEMELLDNSTLRIQKGKKDAGRTIKLADVVSVTLKKPGLTMAGCLHVQVLGAKTYSAVANATHYATDMNAICFRKKEYDSAVAFKDALDAAIASKGDDRQQTTSADELRQLKQLLDDGIITQEDFDRKKEKILGL